MEGLNKLTFLSDKDLEYIKTSERMYRQNARIFFRVHEYNERKNDVTVKVWQDRNPIGKYLSMEELRERAKDLFNMLPDGMRLHVHAREFIAFGLKDVNIEWIKTKMEEYNLKQADLVDYLNVNKSTISEWLSESKELTEIHKTMFFYFFKAL